MRAHALLLALVAAGCGAESLVLSGPIPSDTRFVAALLTATDGSLATSTALEPYTPGAPIHVERDGVRAEIQSAHVYAFVEEPSGRGDTPLSFAAPRDPELPAASWVGAGQKDGARIDLAEIDDAPAVTAPWLQRCPKVLAEGVRFAVDQRCVPRPCAPQPRQRSCELEHDMESCVLGSVRFAIDGVGTLLPANMYTQLSCVEDVGPEGVLLSYACDSCRVDIYEVGAEPPPFTIETLELYPGGGGERRRTGPFDGYLGDLLVLGDRVVVSSYAGDADAYSCEVGGRASTFWFINADDFVVTGTAAVGGCQRQLAADTSSTGFFALRGDGPGVRFSRFRSDGVRVGRIHSLAVTGDHQPTGLVATTNPPRVAIAATEGDDGLFFLFDADTLALAGMRHETSRLGSLEVGEGESILLGWDGFVDFVSPVDAARQDSVNLGTGTSIGIDSHRMRYLSALDRYVIVNSSDVSGVYVATRVEGVSKYTVPYVERAAVSAAEVWPPDDRFALVGMMGYEDSRARLALLEVEIVRFQPQTFEIGEGPVTAIHTDARGRIWMLLPWEGRVLRLTPR